MIPATDPQMSFVFGLHDRIKARDGSDLEFYRIVEAATGKRSTEGLSKAQASKLIDLLKEELDG